MLPKLAVWLVLIEGLAAAEALAVGRLTQFDLQASILAGQTGTGGVVAVRQSDGALPQERLAAAHALLKWTHGSCNHLGICRNVWGFSHLQESGWMNHRRLNLGRTGTFAFSHAHVSLAGSRQDSSVRVFLYR